MPVIRRPIRLLFLLALFTVPALSQPFTYWRLNILNAGPFTELSLFEFFDGTGTLIPTTGGTASASNATFGAAANAFDGNTSTFWASNGAATPSSPVWIQYQFPSAVTVASFLLEPRSVNQGGPDTFELQASNDGSTWTHEGYYSIPVPYATTSPQTFTVNPTQGNGTAWRLLITATQGNTFAEEWSWKLYDTGGSAISISGGYSQASSEFDYTHPSILAFDGVSLGGSPAWDSLNTPSAGSPEYVQYRFSSAVSVCSFTLQGSVPARNPSQFQLQTSTDGITFTTVGTYTAATWTSIAQVQTFNVSGCSHSTATMILY